MHIVGRRFLVVVDVLSSKLRVGIFRPRLRRAYENARIFRVGVVPRKTAMNFSERWKLRVNTRDKPWRKLIREGGGYRAYYESAVVCPPVVVFSNFPLVCRSPRVFRI